MANKVKEGFGAIQPSSGTAARQAGGGFPFGHEYGSTAREADVELAHLAKDNSRIKAEEEAEAKKKSKDFDKSGKVKSFEEFISQSQALQEMDGAVAASPTNTPGMGNVTPGEVGSGDKWGEDDDDEKKKKGHAMSRDEWRKWKKNHKNPRKERERLKVFKPKCLHGN